MMRAIRVKLLKKRIVIKIRFQIIYTLKTYKKIALEKSKAIF